MPYVSTEQAIKVAAAGALIDASQTLVDTISTDADMIVLRALDLEADKILISNGGLLKTATGAGWTVTMSGYFIDDEPVQQSNSGLLREAAFVSSRLNGPVYVPVGAQLTTLLVANSDSSVVLGTGETQYTGTRANGQTWDVIQEI